jgi:hypothetical protein
MSTSDKVALTAETMNITDRGLIKKILSAQRDIAKILFLMNVTNTSREAAGQLHTELDGLLKSLAGKSK